MTGVDAAAAAGAFVASFSLGMRANLLKPKISTWADAPDWVWMSMIALSVAMGCAGLNIAWGAHATSREAMAYAVLGMQTTVLLLNLIRNGRKRP